MKKVLAILSLTTIGFSSAVNAQSEEVDKKWRFGLKVNPQPSWFVTTDKNVTPAGSLFGYGFGLNIERNFSKVAALLFGIGGDFEGGKYTFKYDNSANYVVRYFRDADQFVLPSALSSTNSATTKLYELDKRVIKTTHVTLPVILKLSTAEYGGMKYFGMFGAELGVRIKATATDTYKAVYEYDSKSATFTIPTTVTEEKDIDLTDEATFLPLRLGLNAGIGTEYRLGGTTSAFISLNFFRSFTNLMAKQSDYSFYRVELVSGAPSYTFIKQNIKQTAIRINLGIMF